MKGTEALEFLRYHTDWMNKGYSFEYISSIYDKLSDEDHPFSSIGIFDIQQHIGGAIFTELSFKMSDLEKFKFIFYKNHGFEDDLELIHRCINLEYIKIGCACEGSIESLQPLKNCTKLKYVDLHRHKISDLSPLSKLEKLEELILWGNPIKSFLPIVHLKHLKKLHVDEIVDEELLKLLMNSPGVVVTYFSEGKNLHIEATLVDGNISMREL